MKKILFLMVLSTCVIADETVIWRDSDEIKEGITESQWVMFLGAEVLKLDSIQNFSLNRKVIGDRSNVLYGPALGMARKWYILGNLSTTTEPMIYFLQSDKQDVQTPTKEEIRTYHVSEFKETTQFYGARIAQSIGYTFEFNSFYLEPFFQAYVGQGFGRTKIHYHWDAQISSEHEEFDSSIHEQITHQGFALGVQLTARNGYSSFLKVSKNTLTYRKRKTENYTEQAGTVSVNSSDENLNENIDKYTVTLGLGYIF